MSDVVSTQIWQLPYTGKLALGCELLSDTTTQFSQMQYCVETFIEKNFFMEYVHKIYSQKCFLEILCLIEHKSLPKCHFSQLAVLLTLVKSYFYVLIFKSLENKNKIIPHL